MSLFIGNISSTTKASDLEDLFKKYGPCKIALKTSYGFVDFESYKDAEKALDKCNKKEVGGAVIELKWSARMKRERRHSHRDKDHHSSRRDRRSRSRSKSRSRDRRREERHRRRHEKSRSRDRRRSDRKSHRSSNKDKEDEKSSSKSSRSNSRKSSD